MWLAGKQESVEKPQKKVQAKPQKQKTLCPKKRQEQQTEKNYAKFNLTFVVLVVL